MPIGIALVLIFILYLIDKHGLWKKAVKVTIYLVIAAVIVGAGLYGWARYEDTQEQKQQEAETARMKPYWDCVSRNVQFSNAAEECGKDSTVVLHAVVDTTKNQPIPKPNVRRVRAVYPTDLVTTEYGSLKCGEVAQGEVVVLLEDDPLFVKVRTSQGVVGWASANLFEVVGNNSDPTQ